MEEKVDVLNTLLERAADYGNTSLELVKLKAIDKTTDIISSVIPLVIFILLVTSFLVFLNLGIAFWLGEILGKEYYGFFIVAAFYILLGLIIRFLLNKWIKKLIGDYFIRHILK